MQNRIRVNEENQVQHMDRTSLEYIVREGVVCKRFKERLKVYAMALGVEESN